MYSILSRYDARLCNFVSSFWLYERVLRKNDPNFWRPRANGRPSFDFRGSFFASNRLRECHDLGVKYQGLYKIGNHYFNITWAYRNINPDILCNYSVISSWAFLDGVQRRRNILLRGARPIKITQLGGHHHICVNCTTEWLRWHHRTPSHFQNKWWWLPRIFAFDFFVEKLHFGLFFGQSYARDENFEQWDHHRNIVYFVRAFRTHNC